MCISKFLNPNQRKYKIHKYIYKYEFLHENNNYLLKVREEGKKKTEEERRRVRREKLLLEKAKKETNNSGKGKILFYEPMFCGCIWVKCREKKGNWVKN